MTPPRSAEPVPRRGLWLALVATAGALTAGAAALLWPRRAVAHEVDAGAVSEFPIGSVRHVRLDAPAHAEERPGAGGAARPPRGARDFHLVRRPDGFVAFWHRCTHLGCAVPFREDAELPGAFGPDGRPWGRGLFRCPCHGSTFSRGEAEAVAGPAPRPLDVLPVRVRGGRVLVTVREGAERQRRPGEGATAAGPA